MKKLFVIIMLLAAVTAESLAGGPVWHSGYLILPDGRKLDGQLNYNWKAEVVQLRLPDGLLKAYLAGYVDSFVYYDKTQQLLRFFNTVDLPGPDQELRPVADQSVQLPDGGAEHTKQRRGQRIATPVRRLRFLRLLVIFRHRVQASGYVVAS
jgi:hypothetical protein